MRHCIRAALLTLLVVPLALGIPLSVRAEEMRIDTRDGARIAIVPPASRARAPTVIVLHGATISAELTARRSGFAEAASQQGFAAVFPKGIYRLWNDGREDRLASIDDVGFLRQLVGELVRRGIADPARIYMAGISNGGMMTFRMLCEASELFAGAGTVIANMPAAIGETCQPKKRLPIVMFNGTADPLVPYEGGGVGFGGRNGTVWAAERTAAFLARANGCGAASEMLQSGTASAEAIKVTRLDWSACTSGQPVTLYRIEGGGHQLFGRTNILPFIFGPGTAQVSVPETIMDIFARAHR